VLGARLFLGERLTRRQLLGIALVLSGVVALTSGSVTSS
jgi:drug/metabolite transporter (DMT)-like permease